LCANLGGAARTQPPGCRQPLEVSDDRHPRVVGGRLGFRQRLLLLQELLCLRTQIQAHLPQSIHRHTRRARDQCDFQRAARIQPALQVGHPLALHFSCLLQPSPLHASLLELDLLQTLHGMQSIAWEVR